MQYVNFLLHKYIRMEYIYVYTSNMEIFMFTIDEDRRKLLTLRRMIHNMEVALEEAKEFADELEEKTFEQWEIEFIGRAQ